MNEVITYKEILDYVLRKKSPKDDGILSKDERFKIINEEKVDKEVYLYLKEILQPLKIEIVGDYEGQILELMRNRYLERWCFQTTESSIVFFNDSDYIERGNLKFNEFKYYWHSWINFKYKDKEYTFDPCLNIICKKQLYKDIFETDVRGSISSLKVRNYLIDYILNYKPKELDMSERSIRRRKMVEEFFSQYNVKINKNEIKIVGNDDVNSPMYRNSTGYIADINDGKIKKLVARFYENS